MVGFVGSFLQKGLFVKYKKEQEHSEGGRNHQVFSEHLHPLMFLLHFYILARYRCDNY